MGSMAKSASKTSIACPMCRADMLLSAIETLPLSRLHIELYDMVFTEPRFRRDWKTLSRPSKTSVDVLVKLYGTEAVNSQAGGVVTKTTADIVKETRDLAIAKLREYDLEVIRYASAVDTAIKTVIMPEVQSVMKRSPCAKAYDTRVSFGYLGDQFRSQGEQSPFAIELIKALKSLDFFSQVFITDVGSWSYSPSVRLIWTL